MNERILVTRPFLPERKTFTQYIDRIWENRHLTNRGPLHEEFTKSLADVLGCEHVTLTTNGHLALEIAVKALNLTGEIITTPYTFVSTTHSIAANGITPVFCDINETNLTINADLIEGLITEKTTAIMPVHVYGHLCDVDKIDSIAKKYNLKVIYDAAHAFAVEKDGRSVSQYGNVSMFSFHATKLFHSIEGGALTCADKNLKAIFDAYRGFGIENEEVIEHIGTNAKMNEFQAAMGLSILPHIQEIITERKAITMHYRKKLDSVKGISYFTPDADTSVFYNYAYMPIIVDSNIAGFTRDDLFERLKEKEIYARKYFYPLTSDFARYRELGRKAALPVAHKTANQILCLPIYNGLAKEVVGRICEVISKSV